ncbi:hypothetical protein CBR_g31149 [Chara braunii]|uniref:Uncharacterized protein n=1 Tax=Chara braunii TaxID=69332 RepID=A0A388LEF2_CHABU|nr:hypothetical protein CBR_g31149 [Chara braunii]|eukprot:GBG80690.1 hypothetical protein CBR_g31149 [Chara braunii]
MQEVVDTLLSSQGGRLGTVGGTVLLAPWLEEKMQAMLDIIWELEEGPAPPLDEFVDWHRAGLLMHGCYDIFRRGQDCYDTLEERLLGSSDGLTPTLPATTIDEFCDNNSSYIDNGCNDKDNNDIISGGNNVLNTYNVCIDNDNNDINNSGGGGDNINNDIDNNKNNDINNDNNQCEDINYNEDIEDFDYSFLGMTNENCGNKISDQGDEAMEDKEIDRGSRGAFGAAVWQRTGVE